MSPTLSRRCGRRDRADLGRARDLLHDLDDVAIRIEDAELSIRAVAAREDLVDSLELALGAELARVRLDLLHGPANQLPDRNAVAPDRDAARSDEHKAEL